VKARRHATILRLVRSEPVESQEHLRALLEGEGIRVTQATLSRDLRELRLVKGTDASGTVHYQEPADGSTPHPALPQLAPTLLAGVDGVGNLLVVRTPTGSANALATVLDAQGWDEIIGTLAGDDTILIITRSERARRAIAQRLRQLAEPGG